MSIKDELKEFRDKHLVIYCNDSGAYPFRGKLINILDDVLILEDKDEREDIWFKSYIVIKFITRFTVQLNSKME